MSKSTDKLKEKAEQDVEKEVEKPIEKKVKRQMVVTDMRRKVDLFTGQLAPVLPTSKSKNVLDRPRSPKPQTLNLDSSSPNSKPADTRPNREIGLLKDRHFDDPCYGESKVTIVRNG